MSKIIQVIKEKGFKGFLEDWKKGILMIPPEVLLKQELFGYAGMLIASVLSTIILFYKGYWYIALFFIFNIIVQLATITAKLQQYKLLKGLPSEQINLKEMMGE